MTTSHFDRLGSSEAPDSFTGQTLTRFWGHNITLGGVIINHSHQPGGGGGQAHNCYSVDQSAASCSVAGS